MKEGRSPRRQFHHFTPGELALIAQRYADHVPPRQVAAELGSSIRVIHVRYHQLAGRREPYAENKKPRAEPRIRKPVNKASRFYTSTFEPS